MSRILASRLLAPGAIRVATPTSAARSVAQSWARSFSASSSRQNPDDGPNNTTSAAPARSAMDELAQATSRIALDTVARARNKAPSGLDGEGGSLAAQVGLDSSSETSTQPYHFHIYAHKHNTHVTVTKPNRDAIISVSCGNLGFKKSNRKHYDSAYQLGAYVIDKLHQAGWHKKIKSMEVVLRGYGAGREAVTKILLGSQGRLLRDSIVRVSDATRLKFGGTRSRKPRRLG